jgi:hypothetical protein
MVRNVKAMTLGSAPGCTIDSSSAHSAAIAARTSAMVALGRRMRQRYLRRISDLVPIHRAYVESTLRSHAKPAQCSATWQGRRVFGRGYVFAKSFA